MTQPALQQWIGAGRAFHDEVLRYSLSGFHLEGLERMLVQVNRTLKRNKALDTGRVQGRIVAALDGIEVLSSYSRCCDSCLQCRVSARKAGVKTEQVQYYHRAVGCQIVSSPCKPFLAIEWLQPGEGEDTAALRLLHKLPDLYGSRFFDILLLDALYAQAPVLKLADRIGWDLVISLKQNQRARRWQRRRAARWQAVSVPDLGLGGIPVLRRSPAAGTGRAVRREAHAEPLPPGQAGTRNDRARMALDHDFGFPGLSPTLVRRLGHDRWKLEANGWNDLTQNWAFKHGFLHACRRRPQTASEQGERTQTEAEAVEAGGHPQTGSEQGERTPVANRGLAAVTLILLLAFTLCSAFIHCHSKLFRRYSMSAIEVARQLRFSVSKLPPNIRAPDAPAAPLPG